MSCFSKQKTSSPKRKIVPITVSPEKSFQTPERGQQNPRIREGPEEELKAQSPEKRIRSIKSPYYLHPRLSNDQEHEDDEEEGSPNNAQGLSPMRRNGLRSVGVSFKNKDSIICFFCRSTYCPKENWRNNPNPYLEGLHSDLVADVLVGSCRPSNAKIARYNLVQQFIDKKIGAIFCLQEPGEHPICGDGLCQKSGLSYDPEIFQRKGIYFFNFHWEDMTITDNRMILKIVQLMDTFVARGLKCFVHCHAGTGRTAFICAAYLGYAGIAGNGVEACKIAKQGRPTFFSRKAQYECVYSFVGWIRMQRGKLYPSIKDGVSLQEVIQTQQLILHGQDLREHKFIPKVLAISNQVIQADKEKPGHESLEEYFVELCSKTPWTGFNFDSQCQIKASNWKHVNQQSPKEAVFTVVDFFRNLGGKTFTESVSAEEGIQHKYQVGIIIWAVHFKQAILPQNPQQEDSSTEILEHAPFFQSLACLLLQTNPAHLNSNNESQAEVFHMLERLQQIETELKTVDALDIVLSNHIFHHCSSRKKTGKNNIESDRSSPFQSPLKKLANVDSHEVFRIKPMVGQDLFQEAEDGH